MSRKRSRLKVKLNADAVWELLNRLNMNQNDLARLASITSGYLSLLISGKRCPSSDVRRRLMEAPRRHPLRRSVHRGESR